MNLTLHTATVLRNDDEDLKSKIQIRVLPQMKLVKDDDCPWAIPFCSHNSSGGIEKPMMSADVPFVGETIWVLVDEYWKRFYYVSRRFFEGCFDSETITSIFDNMGTTIDDLEGDDNVSEGPNPLADNLAISDDNPFYNLKFTMYHEGSLMFHNQVDGTHGFIQYTIEGNDTPTFIIIDKDGNVATNVSANRITDITKDDLLHIVGNKVLHVDGETHNEFTGIVDELYHDEVTKEFEKERTDTYDEGLNIEVTKQIDAKTDDTFNLEVSKTCDVKSGKAMTLKTDDSFTQNSQKDITHKSSTGAVSVQGLKDMTFKSTGAGKVEEGNTITTLGKELDNLYDLVADICQKIMAMKTFGPPFLHNVFPADVANFAALMAQAKAKKAICDQCFK